MRAISLFSGVGGMDRGLELAGIETVLQAEIDPWCRAVLERHFPGAERVADVRDVGIDRRADTTGHAYLCADGTESKQQERVHLIHGGFPCQDVSVAGKRAGFRGERSSLWFEFHRVLSELRPRWTLIENVPGLLSSHSGRDFGTVLSGLVDLGYGVAWRTLDAQHFGVPQRRRRVFLVGCLGDQARAAAVLAICEGCGGDSAAGSEAGQELAYSLAASARGTGDGHGNAWNSTYVARGQTSRNERIDGETENFIIANSVRASEGHHGHSSPRGDGADNLIAFSNRGGVGTERLRSDSHGAIPMVASFSENQRAEMRLTPQARQLTSGGGKPGQGYPAALTTQGVRRLTPLECERLMGWPDEWTRWTADGREVPDSIRYRMCGNGVVSPVAEWIGWRLRKVDSISDTLAAEP